MEKPLRCWYCGVELISKFDYRSNPVKPVPSNLHVIDHKIPQILRDQNPEVDRADNLVDACRECNSRKGSRDVQEYRVFLYGETPWGAAAENIYSACAAYFALVKSEEENLKTLLSLCDHIVKEHPMPKFFGEKQ